MRYLAYNVRYSVVPINSSPLIVTLFSSVITTLVYNDTKCSVPFMTLCMCKRLPVEFPCYREHTPLVIKQKLFQHFKDQVKVLFYPKLPDFQKSIAFRKVRLCPSVFVLRGRVEEDEYGA